MRRFFDQFTDRVSFATGTAQAFIVALVSILVWAATGPLFHFSDTWQLIINTSTTIVTFLMTFVLRYSGDKEAGKSQRQLDEQLQRIVALERLLDQHINTTATEHREAIERNTKLTQELHTLVSEMAEPLRLVMQRATRSHKGKAA